MVGYRIIKVEFIYPPIPDRSFDYQAVFSDYDEGDPIGHGPTEQAAIDDLHEEYEARLDTQMFGVGARGVPYERLFR